MDLYPLLEGTPDPECPFVLRPASMFGGLTTDLSLSRPLEAPLLIVAKAKAEVDALIDHTATWNNVTILSQQTLALNTRGVSRYLRDHHVLVWRLGSLGHWTTKTNRQVRMTRQGRTEADLRTLVIDSQYPQFKDLSYLMATLGVRHHLPHGQRNTRDFWETHFDVQYFGQNIVKVTPRDDCVQALWGLREKMIDYRLMPAGRRTPETLTANFEAMADQLGVGEKR